MLLHASRSRCATTGTRCSTTSSAGSKAASPGAARARASTARASPPCSTAACSPPPRPRTWAWSTRWATSAQMDKIVQQRFGRRIAVRDADFGRRDTGRWRPKRVAVILVDGAITDGRPTGIPSPIQGAVAWADPILDALAAARRRPLGGRGRAAGQQPRRLGLRLRPHRARGGPAARGAQAGGRVDGRHRRLGRLLRGGARRHHLRLALGGDRLDRHLRLQARRGRPWWASWASTPRPSPAAAGPICTRCTAPGARTSGRPSTPASAPTTSSSSRRWPAAASSMGIDEKRADDLGRGRVYTGAQARQLGLVDQLGGIDAAIDEAARRGRIPTGPGGLPEMVLLPNAAHRSRWRPCWPCAGWSRSRAPSGSDRRRRPCPPDSASAVSAAAAFLARHGRAAARLILPILLGDPSGIQARCPTTSRSGRRGRAARAQPRAAPRATWTAAQVPCPSDGAGQGEVRRHRSRGRPSS